MALFGHHWTPLTPPSTLDTRYESRVGHEKQQTCFKRGQTEFGVELIKESSTVEIESRTTSALPI